MLDREEVLDIARSLGLTVHDLLRSNSPIYKERRDELLAMEEDQLADLISSEPTLIKRPIIKTEKGYVVGLDEENNPWHNRYHYI